MAAGQRHIIKRQVIEIGLEASEPHQYWLDHFGRWYKQSILPLLDAQFSALSPAGEIIRIDSLEIDLGNIDPDRPDLMARELESQVYEKLYEKCRQARAGRGEGATIIQQARQAKDPTMGAIYTGAAAPSELASELASEEEALFHFLETGSFPWWYQEGVPDQQQLMEILTTLLPVHRQMIMALLRNRASRLRILYGLSPNDAPVFLGKVFSNSKKVVATLDQFFVKWAAIARSQRSVQASVQSWDRKIAVGWQEQFVSSQFERSAPVNPDQLCSEVIVRTIKVQLQQEGFSLAKLIQETVILLKANRLQASYIRQQLVDEAYEDVHLKDATVRNRRQEEKSAQTEDESIFTHSKPAVIVASIDSAVPTEKGSHKGRNSLSTNETWPTEQAGLVLAWCYLQYFFQGLGLMEEGEFRSEADQWEAVHVLYFLATGAPPAEEADLTLCKVLCGLLPEDFVPATLPLSEQEREEADHLAQVIIDNWKVLKKTSVRALRQGFMQRPGVLSRDAQGGWRLQVERYPYDIVLNKLNWPISLIKLPWLEQMISVEW